MSSLSKVVGITGGIGCGKTTVLREFSRLGIPCFVADDEAKKCYEDAVFSKEIIDHFGDGIVQNGAVDKKALAEIVFADPDELRWLNSKVHPWVMSRFETWKLSCGDVPYVLFESAIIFEADLDYLFDKIITVYLEKEERISRLLERDSATREQLEARMNSQLDEDEKLMRADYVILNHEGNPRRMQVEYFHNILK